MKYRRTDSILLIAFCLLAGTAIGAENSVDFDRDVLPILSDRCFLCHGPDAGTNESGLRLDIAEDAVKELPSGEGHAIVPGAPDASAVIVRILSDDPSLKMPPAESNLSLSEHEIATLKNWIAQGAVYKKHWAFNELPSHIPVPTVPDSKWPRNSIDHFVLNKLAEHGLQPSKDADRWRWLRRITFNLTGLPPTSKEVDAFTADTSADAYEKVVDRLLTSKRFGEHMAVAWLDAARYADSYGYQSDQLNTQWPYRDWVVRAINDNLPYNDFLVWQLAGDLLPNPTDDQRLATAFNRLHRMTNEGGAVFEEWRIEGVSDRVHTFGTAMLGLTLECSRCHDHKYDPITMRDYYSLSAFFNSIDENGLYDHAAKVPSPTMLLTDATQKSLLESDRVQIQAAEQSYARILNEQLDRLKQSQDEVLIESSPSNGLMFQSGFDRAYDPSLDTTFAPVTDNLAATDYPQLVDVVEIQIPQIDNDSATRKALKLDGERGISVKGIPAFERWQPFTVVTTIKLPKHSQARAVIAQDSRGTDAGFNGWDLTIENGYIESRLYRVWPGNAIGIRTQEPVPEDSWIQLATTYDGSSRAAGLSIAINGKIVPTHVLRNKMVKSVTAEMGDGRFVLGQRFRSRGLVGGLVDDLRIYSRALVPQELHELATGLKGDDYQLVHALNCDPDVLAATNALFNARKKLVLDEEVLFEVPIMEEMASSRETHILARGQYDAPRSDMTRVSRNTFELLAPSFPSDLPQDRLGLARWLTQPNHPLTARVAVNRLWASFFGNGLVDTPENFGRQGARPVNQELLDWLARDFVDHGWDVKRTARLIALSSTYRQDSQLNAHLIETDPENKFFARGPAYRLDAEAIRDSALAVAGLLNEKVGGAPVSPYQAGGDLWRESNTMSPAYHQSIGKDLYRRSIYSVWKRTAPLPNMMAFDSPTREVCTVKRSRTNTPLQALVLLNDTQIVEACRVYSTALASIPNPKDRIEAAFKCYCSRDATGSELQELQRMYDEELRHFSNNPADAADLVSVGETEFRAGHQWEVAAMTVVCLSIQNLDAAVWLR
jgi:hypothetical protein